MSLYNWFLTNPFGPGTRTIEWIYTGWVGGAQTDLDSEPTFGADDGGTNVRIVAINNTTAEVWQLMPGDEATDPPNGWIRPLDWQLSLNEKVWHRLLCFGTGGGTGPPMVLNEIPTGAIDGTNTLFTTVFEFAGINLDVYLNGLRQRYAVDYTVPNSTQFILTSIPQIGDSLTVDYIPL